MAVGPSIAYAGPDGEWSDTIFSTDGNGVPSGVFTPPRPQRGPYVMHNYIGIGGLMMWRDRLVEAGGFSRDDCYDTLSDYDCILRLLDVGSIGVVGEVRFGYRVHPSARRYNRPSEEDHAGALEALRRSWMVKWGFVDEEVNVS